MRFTRSVRRPGGPGLRQQMRTVEMRPGLHLRVDLVDAGEQRVRVVGDRELARDHARARIGGAQCGQDGDQDSSLQRL